MAQSVAGAVAQLGRVVGADFEQGYRQVQDRMAQTDQDRLEKLNEISQSLGGVFERMFQSTEAFDRSEQQLLARYDGLCAAADQLGTTLERTAHQSQNVMEVQARAFEQYQQHDVASIMSDLQKAIDRLTERLAIERAQVGRRDSLTEMEPISGDDKPSGDNHPQRGVFGFLRRGRDA